jgi:hypothetical protein
MLGKVALEIAFSCAAHNFELTRRLQIIKVTSGFGGIDLRRLYCIQIIRGPDPFRHKPAHLHTLQSPQHFLHQCSHSYQEGAELLKFDKVRSFPRIAVAILRKQRK